MHLYEQGLFRFLILKMWTEDTDSCYNRNKSKIGIINKIPISEFFGNPKTGKGGQTHTGQDTIPA